MPPAAPSPHPAAPDLLVALADRCVQCGLCLPACPTYGQSRIEAESPRGRIALARAWALGAIDPTPPGEAHLDHCLGCRGCESVCPAGVQYGALLAEARGRQRERRPPRLRQRLMETLVARPALLSGLLRAYGHLRPWLPARWRLLPAPASAESVRPAPGPAPAPSERIRAGLFVGCAARAYETELRDAASRCFAILGVDLHAPPAQTCCGSVHAHAGAKAGAARLAARNRAAFARDTTVLVLASGCHEAVAQSLSGTQTVDALAFLAQRLAAREGAWRWRAAHERVALHLPCTQRNVVRSAASLRAMLSAVPGLEVVELDAGSGCCGASGTQMLLDSARASDFRAPLLRQLEDSGATRLLSANLGCRLHLANGAGLPVQHPLEFLAQRIEATPSPRAVSPGD